MAATTRIAALKSALVDRWRAIGDLAGVQILSAGTGKRDATEYILLVGEDTISQEWGGIGRLARDEELTLVGAVVVMKGTTPGDPEDTIREARDRAVALMAILEASLWDTANAPSVGGIVKSALARPTNLNEGVDGEGRRFAAIRFEVRTGKTRLQNS